MSDGHQHTPPPSAAGFLEPFGMRVTLGPAPGGFGTEDFLTGLLQDLAAACEAAGATVIGHLKCFLSSGEAGVHCNLTSTRLGARCGGASGAVPLDRPVELDLAVLVYGLPAATIATLAAGVLDSRLFPLGIAWRQV
jgi:hypothetical protein